MTLGELRAALRRHRVLVAACVLGTVALAGAYTYMASPVYEATSVIRFEQEQINLPQLVQQLSTENRISTEIEVLQERSAAVAVIDSLGLRARMVAPRRGRPSQLFAVLRPSSAADTVTLTLQRTPSRSFTVRRGAALLPDTAIRVGDTVQLADVSLALAPAALQAPEIQLRVVSLDDAVRSFESRLKVARPVRDADLIAVRVRSADPVQATAAANLLAEQLISGRRQLQRARTGSNVRFLRQQLDTLGSQLRVAENRLRAFRERAQVVDAQEQARTQVDRLAQLQADRGALEAEQHALAQLVQQMRSDSGARPADAPSLSRRLVSFPTLFKNQAASELLGALAQVENERSQLLQRRKPEDPDVLVLTARVRELDTQLEGIAETYLQGLTNQVGALRQVARGFGNALDSLPGKQVQLARLQRDVTMQQDLYTLIQTRLKEAEITQAMEDPSVRIVDAGAVPDRPIRPILFLNIALSIVLGSMIGVTAALGRELTNRSIRSRSDALLAAGVPVLGAVPRMDRPPLKLSPGPGARRRRSHRSRGLRGATRRLRRAIGWGDKVSGAGAAARIESLLVTRPGTTAAYAESWNQLHANLLLAHRDRPLKVLLFTSALPAEGKTLSTINFALTLAGQGLRVLLIDADLRCGLVGEVFRIQNHAGFAELLAGSVTFDTAAERIPVGDTGVLTILPAGGSLPGAGQRLLVERVQAVLDALVPQFDLILLDSPPVNLLADASLLGSAADAVLLVVRAGHTQTDSLSFAIDQLTVARAPLIGTLLNDIDLRRSTGDDTSYRYLAAVEDYYAPRP